MVQQRGSPEASTAEVNDVEARVEVQALPWVIFHFGWRHARHSFFRALGNTLLGAFPRQALHGSNLPKDEGPQAVVR